MLVMLFRALAWLLGLLPRNRLLCAYTISTNGSPYLTRILFPRLFGKRVMLHWIRRADGDRHCHNHPWVSATTRILRGGYIEERVTDHDTGATTERMLVAGDRARVDATDFHRIASVAPNTWTLFVAGPTAQSWGFLVAPHRVVDHHMYRVFLEDPDTYAELNGWNEVPA